MVFHSRMNNLRSKSCLCVNLLNVCEQALSAFNFIKGENINGLCTKFFELAIVDDYNKLDWVRRW